MFGVLPKDTSAVVAVGVTLSDDCVRKVSQAYSQQSVAIRYIDVYQQAMAFKHYKL